MQFEDDIFGVIERKRIEGFGMGILMGVRLMGATRERLQEIAQGWFGARES